MTSPTYTPRAGSLASQVIGFFRHNPDEELLLDDITDKLDRHLLRRTRNAKASDWH